MKTKRKQSFVTLTVKLERTLDNRMILHDLAAVDIMEVINTFVQGKYSVKCEDFKESGTKTHAKS